MDLLAPPDLLPWLTPGQIRDAPGVQSADPWPPLTPSAAMTVTPAASATGVTSAALTTGSFTPAVGELLVAVVTAGTSAALPVTWGVADSQSVTWRQGALVHAGLTGSTLIGTGAAIFTREIVSGAASMTVTSTPSSSGGTVEAHQVQIYRVASTAPKVRIATAAWGYGFAENTATINPSVLSNLVPTSLVFVGAADWFGGGTAASTDLTVQTFNAGGTYEGLAGFKQLTGTARDARPVNVTNGLGGSNGQWHWVGMEVVAYTPLIESRTQYGIAAGGSLPYLSSADLATRLDRMAALGPSYIRFDLSWSDIQPTGPGSTFDWSLYDPVVFGAAARGMSPLLLINGGTPAWARNAGAPTDPMASPQNASDLANFAAAAVARYSSVVRVYEFWNEPNLSGNWDPISTTTYTTCLQAAYTAMKAVDSTCTILLGGISRAYTGGSDIETYAWLQGVYAAGGKGSFDAVAVHPYTFPADPFIVDPLNFWTLLGSMRALMLANGDDKKIWVTEYGGRTDGPGTASTVGHWSGLGTSDKVDPNMQAWLAYASIHLRRATDYLGPLLWFTDIDTGANPAVDQEYFGLYYGDGTAKPAQVLWTTPTANLVRLVTDSIGLAEGLTRALALPRPLTETLSAGESLARIATHPRSLTETLSAGESLARAVALPRAVTDAVAAGEALARALALPRPLTETLALGESLARAAQAFPRAVTDVLVLAEALARAVTYPKAVTDAVALAETLTGTPVKSRAVVDTIGLGESLARAAQAFPRAVTDAVVLAEALARTTGSPRQLVDSVAIGDVLARGAATSRAVADTVALAEALARVRTVPRALVDTLALADVLARVLAAPRSVVDAIGLAESLGYPRAWAAFIAGGAAAGAIGGGSSTGTTTGGSSSGAIS